MKSICNFFFSVLLNVLLWGLCHPSAYSRERIFYLDQLDLAHVKQGWGTAQKNLSVQKNPIKINGKVYERGIGTHAASELTMVLDGKAKRFHAVAGINDEACERATLTFSVWADGQRKYYSGIVSQKKQKEYGPLSISLELDGVKELSLVVDDGNNGISCDHASWAEAFLELSEENFQPRAVTAAGHIESLEANLMQYDRKQYEPYSWQTPQDAFSFQNPPLLQNQETFPMWSQVAYHGKQAVIPVVFREGKADQEARLIFYNPVTGKSARVGVGNTRVWGLTSGPDKDTLWLGMGRKLVLFDLKAARPVEEREFFRAGTSDFVRAGESLVVRSGSEFEIYEAKSLKLQKKFSLGINRIQRMTAWEENQVLLSSTYWGASFRRLHLEKETLSDGQLVRMPFHFHGLLRCVFVPEQKALGLFDITDKRGFGMLKPYLEGWVFVDQDTQVLPDERGVRHSPRRFILEAKVTVKAERDMKESEVNAALMPKEVHNHTITKEKVLPGSRMLLDKLGNRHLVFSLPAMKKGQIFEKKIYQADIILYNLQMNVQKAEQIGDLPDDKKIYLLDDAWYDFEHPVLVKKYQEITRGLSKSTDIVQAVYNFAQSMEGKDVPISAAPDVIKLNGGGCNNHTRVQIALLRKAGIPARFAWNFWGVKEPGEIGGNHWIAEAWLPGLGWIPMEGQHFTYTGGPGALGAHYLIQRAGHTDVRQYKRHLTPQLPWAEDLGAAVSVQWLIRNWE